jgi:hypothetical protein
MDAKVGIEPPRTRRKNGLEEGCGRRLHACAKDDGLEGDERVGSPLH